MFPEETVIGKDVKISPEARINVTEKLVIGDRTVIGKGALIEGREVVIGREAWIDEFSHIGGGSCFELDSKFMAGDFLHMGKYSHVNTAMPVTIGEEVGIGINTKIFTHGSYLSFFEGFPVSFDKVRIGNRVWIPNSIVNPGVVIGNDVVVAALSLINKDLPSGCLAGGIPVKVIKENQYPSDISNESKEKIISFINHVLSTDYSLSGHFIVVRRENDTTIFDLKNKKIDGIATTETEILKNQLRRVGVRFKFYNQEGVYRPW